MSSESAFIDLDAQCVVVFDGRSSIPWLRILRPGFRHCFCLIKLQRRWLVIDPLKGTIEFAILESATAEMLANHYRGFGLNVLTGTRRIGSKRGQLMPMPITCVEVVKRAIGARKALAITPYHLFRHLRDECGFHAFGAAAFNQCPSKIIDK